MSLLRTASVSVIAGAIGLCMGLGCSLARAQGAEQAAASVYPAPAIRIVEVIDDARLVTLKGNTHPMARAANDAGRLSADTPMGDLVLVLRRSAEQQAEFDAFVAGQYDPKSSHYHHWLAPNEVGEQFGPAQSDLEAVSNWLRDRGFAIDEVSKDRLSIRFSGVAGQVESAFHTQMHNLAVKTKGQLIEHHIGNMADPQIPAALAPVVVGVKALHDFFPKPLHRLGGQVTRNGETGEWRRTSLLNSPALLAQAAPVAPVVRPRPQFGTQDGYGNPVEDVAPYDFATIYNVLPLWNASTPIDGTGQTIAIAGTSNISVADVAAFRSAFGLPAKAPSVVITNNDPGACPTFAASCAGDLVENTLDVEWAGAVAKGASIVLVTSSAPTPTSDALYLSESYIVQNKTAPVMNVSYGECELVLGTGGNTLYKNLWQSAASEGIAVFVASGDSGSPSCDQGFDAVDGVPYLALYGVSVSGLTSTPYNTSVGGTDFNWGSAPAPYWNATNSTTTKASAAGYIPEVPWNSSCVNPLVLPALQSDAAFLGVSGVVDAESACNFVGANAASIYANYGVDLAGLVDTVGGGGGASNCATNAGDGNPSNCQGGYAKPSWQASVLGIPKDGVRDVPDVSFFASNGFLGTSYLICVSASGSPCTYSATTEPVAQEVGGTSVGSPAMAGVMALINQKIGTAQGNPNTNLYALAARESYSSCSAETVKASSAGCIFNDIDMGTNAMACLNPAIEQTFNCLVSNPQDEAGILSGYNAGVGYDLATGLGSLNVANLANNWPTANVAGASFSPTSLSFAATTVNVASATQAITLKNTGKAALAVSGITIAGTNASSFTQTNNCGTSLAVAASCTITVTFKPAAAGALAASVSVADNAYGSPQTVALSGTGVAAAAVAVLSANSISFGSTEVGATNTAPAITLSNTGSGPLTISSLGFTGTNATSFAQSNTCGASVAAGANCSITIAFKPIVAGSLSASLSVADNASGSPQTLTVSGTATGGTTKPTVTLSPASLTFPATTVGATSAAQVITFTNAGTTAVLVNSFSFTGTNATAFVVTTKTCTISLAAGASCTLSVALKPTVAGAQTASFLATDNAAGSPQMVALSGSTATSAPTVTISPASLAFASTAVGATSAAQIVTLKNTGTVAATITGFTYSGTNANSFVTSAQTCTATLAASASCTVSVTFKPAAAGNLSGTLSAKDNAANSPQAVALTGTATASSTKPTVALSPASLTFPATAIGATSAAQVITFTNTGAIAASVNSFAFTGTNATAFTIPSKTCTISLPAGASCTLSVVFKPTVSGGQTASFLVTDNAVGSPQSVALSGTGTSAGATPAVTLSPSTLTFPATAVGSTSPAQVLTFSNKGSTSVSVSYFAFTGANASSFVVTAKTCTVTLAANTSCTLSVGLKPAAMGALTANFQATDNAAGSPQVVSLTGTGK